MPELGIDTLALLDEHRSNPLVLRFVKLTNLASRSEKISHLNDWIPEEQAAYRSDDWETFSCLRPYTKEEIADFWTYLELSADLATKYGTDSVSGIARLVERATRAYRI